ncbi:MAG: transpeptidase family protein [Deltaproteobacteria bacterium]|nr:transpeptidase family protein [Deltaproteobacteria bacterium]
MKGCKNKNRWLRFRIILTLTVFAALFVVLLSRAFQLQVFSGRAMKVRAENQYTRKLKVTPTRGVILERGGQELAATIMVDSLYANPTHISDPRIAARRLAPILSLDARQLAAELSRRKSFCWVKRKITPQESEGVKALNIKGVYFVKESKRFYPNRELACHVLGVCGLDSDGLEGLELACNDNLRESGPEILWRRDAKGKALYTEAVEKADSKTRRHSVMLTIDGPMQYIVERQLKEAVERSRSGAGTAIVMDPRTGEILAMANVPSFNCNNFEVYSRQIRKNRAVIDSFEPGSIFKPFIVAAALEEGVVVEGDRFNCENGSYRVGPKTIREALYKKYKELTASEILKHSSNIGSVKVAERLGKEPLHRYLKAFGFGEKTGVGLPGEASGIVSSASDWTSVDFAAISFGQGLSVTPIQLIAAMSAIARDGVLMRPYIVKAVIDSKGKVVEEFGPQVVRKVISPEAARQVRRMLVEVVENGTGKAARLADVLVGGKTGTAQKYDTATGAYSIDRVVASFIGFFPVEDPQMIVLVILDEPQLNRWGGEAAAPAFKDISEQLVRSFADDMPTRRMAGGEGTGGRIVMTSAPDIAEQSSQEREGDQPDFRGMSLRRVLKIARNRGMTVSVNGSGWAVAQKRMNDKDGNPQYHVIFSSGPFMETRWN